MTQTPEGTARPGGRLRAVLTGLLVLAAAGGLALGVRPLVAPPEQAPPVALSPVPTDAPAPAVTTPPAAEPTPAPEATAPAPPPEPEPTQPPPAPPIDPRLRPFVGLSTWIDIYDIELTPAEQIQRAAAGGVQLIYVQSARHKSPTDIQDADRLGQVYELAHDAGMQVMVWYVPDFVRDRRDLRRSQAAIAFQSPRGDRADAFGLDIEIEDNPDPADRSRRLIALSRRLREWVGPDYPMAAVVLPPLQLDLRPGWWPNFPWAQIRPYYDVFIPMSYSSFRGTDRRTTYRWNVGNVVEMRRLTGDPTLPVHIAGGIADNFPEVGAFVRAVRDTDALGGGLYDLHTTQPEAWPALRRLRVDPPG
ncbi:MAG TPA: hypothetical protein VM307_07925 [Egibacteraceae bacterium]|nr:hypothetical protein [Egibacteraceae bacterium]